VKCVIEIVESLAEDEVVIRCRAVNDAVRNIQQTLSHLSAPAPDITFFKEDREFYFPLDEVLFFETEGEHIYAHTASDAFLVKYRLYELEELLPRAFVRAAKSAIINTAKVYSVTRNLTAANLVNFRGSHKHVYVSRGYYGLLRQRLSERSNYEA